MYDNEKTYLTIPVNYYEKKVKREHNPYQQSREEGNDQVTCLNQPTILESDKSKKDGKDQEMIKSTTTPDPGYHMGK